jgi:repressor LexA
MKKSLPPLSLKEKSVLEFIENELMGKGLSPSYQEICDHFGFASLNSVQNYLKQLSAKGYVELPQNQKRAIHILHSAKDFHKNLEERLNSESEKSDSNMTSIPFLGRVAAGAPIERFAENEFINVPTEFMKSPGNYFALKVEGDSMIEEGIFDGDFLVVLSQKAAKDGDLVVASIDQESTVKRFFNKKNPQADTTEKQIELRPANSKLKSMWYHPQMVDIKGLVKALLRKY